MELMAEKTYLIVFYYRRRIVRFDSLTSSFTKLTAILSSRICISQLIYLSRSLIYPCRLDFLWQGHPGLCRPFAL